MSRLIGSDDRADTPHGATRPTSGGRPSRPLDVFEAQGHRCNRQCEDCKVHSPPPAADAVRTKIAADKDSKPSGEERHRRFPRGEAEASIAPWCCLSSPNKAQHLDNQPRMEERSSFGERSADGRALDDTWDIKTEPCSSKNISINYPTRVDIEEGKHTEGNDGEGCWSAVKEKSVSKNVREIRKKGEEDKNGQSETSSSSEKPAADMSLVVASVLNTTTHSTTERIPSMLRKSTHEAVSRWLASLPAKMEAPSLPPIRARDEPVPAFVHRPVPVRAPGWLPSGSPPTSLESSQFVFRYPPPPVADRRRKVSQDVYSESIGTKRGEMCGNRRQMWDALNKFAYT
ncbi:hypothetical protein PHLGIDRAFT_16810 [Phlebiopsis gigantea 11061_1 CR5-6]|uniref:Uncharacterized protein n=1 Tax=Phlebiopsis gigantea (strain 11061_1 CR5-6) TaxID=745531 RepID=A0A0C3S2W3_PHLG1|nr:hypothetical protein PHLGIDRAFT_16810 [Phlebiopsis gigantea 11061_1 CR5-6]